MLLERARRILASEEGNFTPSPPPALLDSITDELLVVASDTVAAVATQAPTKPSAHTQGEPEPWPDTCEKTISASTPILERMSRTTKACKKTWLS